MNSSFPDRSKILFGREPDLAYLLKRAERPGLTAVVGRAQMGKSWVLTELARQLALDEGRIGLPGVEPLGLQRPPQYVIGFCESFGESADLLLRGVVDVYSRWLSDSSYWEQAQVVYKQQGKDLVGKAGEAFGTIFEKLSKLGSKPIEAMGGLVKETFDGLANANRELLSGGIQLPRLQIEQGKDLLALVHKITGTQIVLIFDQWEKSPGIETEANVLDSFLRHVEDWPPCHIFLGLRPDEKPYAAVNRLQGGLPGMAEVYELKPMDLDKTSGGALAAYIRTAVTGAAGASDEDLLEMISGYPGTVARWTSSYYARRLESTGELKKIADDANAYRFAEFDDLLPKLSDSERVLAIRLALMPECVDAENWKALKTVALEEAHAKDLDVLKRMGVLESITPPTYGHAKRWEAASRWYTDHCYVEQAEICERLTVSLGSRVRKLTPDGIPYLSSLANLGPFASELSLSPIAQALCETARTILQFPDIDYERAIGFLSETNKVTEVLAPLLAMGLLNTLNRAEQEDALSLRDGLLGWLRFMERTYPGEATVREALARGLYDTVNHDREKNMSDRRDGMLEELQSLASGDPDDETTRRMLAKCLLNMLIYAEEDRELDRRDMLLEDLRKLGRTYPEDATVREQLSKGLLVTLDDLREENVPDQRQALLEELQSLTRENPKDGAIREKLAIGLFNMLNRAKEENALDWRDRLLEGLRELSRAYPEDAEVRECVAMGLVNTLVSAREEKALRRRIELLEELRAFVRAYPEDAVAREWFTKGLYAAIYDFEDEDADEMPEFFGFLEELRTLAQDYPEDPAVKELLAPIKHILDKDYSQEAEEQADSELENE